MYYSLGLGLKYPKVLLKLLINSVIQSYTYNYFTSFVFHYKPFIWVFILKRQSVNVCTVECSVGRVYTFK